MGLSPSKGVFSGNSPFKIGSSPTPTSGFWSLVSNMGFVFWPFPCLCMRSQEGLPAEVDSAPGMVSHSGSPGFPVSVPANLWAL